jgi:hypothetical protein
MGTPSVPYSANPLATLIPISSNLTTYEMIKNLIPNDPAHLKTLLASHRVHDHIAMYANEVLAIEDRVLILAGRINNLYRKILVLVPNDFAERILDGRIVGVDEVAVDELDCQRAFAYSSISTSGLS